MKGLLLMRERLQKFYAGYSRYINKAFQFILALIIFWSINNSLGFFTQLTSPLVVIVCAVVCMLLPLNMTVFLSVVMILAHAYKQSLEAFAVTAALLVILFAIYYRLVPKHAIIVLIVPLACALKIPYILPIALGLCCTPVAMFSSACGLIGYYLIRTISIYDGMATPITEEGPDLLTQIVTYAKMILENKEMYLMIIAFCIIILVVYFIRRLSVNYSWAIAIIVGMILNFLVFIVGSLKLGVEINYSMLIIGNVLALVIALILELLFFTVDYTGTKKVQFEDDEYYYYVKAVPKMRVTLPRKRVQKISGQRESYGGNYQIDEEAYEDEEDFVEL